MTAKPPPIPKEQVRPGENRVGADQDAAANAARGDTNTEQQGRAGNLHQNVETVHARTQDR